MTIIGVGVTGGATSSAAVIERAASIRTDAQEQPARLPADNASAALRELVRALARTAAKNLFTKAQEARGSDEDAGA